MVPIPEFDRLKKISDWFALNLEEQQCVEVRAGGRHLRCGRIPGVDIDGGPDVVLGRPVLVRKYLLVVCVIDHVVEHC